MNSTDPIADFLTRIRNAIRARHKKVDIPNSGVKRDIAKIFAEQKFISSYTELSDKKQGILRISLRYVDGVSAITGLKRISRPGLRVYASSHELPRVLNGMGIAVISTSRGIMTEKQANQEKVGGEILCHVW